MQLIKRNYLVQGSYVFTCVVFVCLLTGLCKDYSTVYYKIRWKGGTWVIEETIRFW